MARSEDALADVELVRQGKGYMRSAVPCFQWEKEFRQLLRIYEAIPPVRVLEIGSYCGGTLYHWLTSGVAYGTVVSVDSYEIVKRTGGTDNRHLYSSWKQPGAELVVIDGNSRDPETVEQATKHGPYNFIFIDAGHLYEEVRDDWENYRPLAKKGNSIVAFHDILPPSRTWPDIQVAWLWKEIKQFGWSHSEIIANPDAEWGGIGLVYL